MFKYLYHQFNFSCWVIHIRYLVTNNCALHSTLSSKGGVGDDRRKLSSPLPSFTSSGEIISSWFKTIRSNWLYRPHLDGRKQSYTLTLFISPLILCPFGNKQGIYLTITITYLMFTTIFEVKQSHSEHSHLVTTHWYWPEKYCRGSAIDWYSLWVFLVQLQ